MVLGRPCRFASRLGMLSLVRPLVRGQAAGHVLSTVRALLSASQLLSTAGGYWHHSLLAECSTMATPRLHGQWLLPLKYQ